MVLARCTLGALGSARRLLSRSRDSVISVCSVVSRIGVPVPTSAGTTGSVSTGPRSKPGSMIAATRAAAATPKPMYQVDRLCRPFSLIRPSASACSRMRCHTTRGGIVSGSSWSPRCSTACSSAVSAQIISSSFLSPLIWGNSCLIVCIQFHSITDGRAFRLRGPLIHFEHRSQPLVRPGQLRL